VRYDIGDRAALGAASCSCGRGLPLLTHVEGKQYPMLWLPAGCWKHASGLTTTLRAQKGLWQYQVIQKTADHVVVRLAIDANWNAQCAAAVQQVVQDFFEAPLRVEIETHERLALPQGGKFQSVICEVALRT
jgi:phenylacetate-CoA ligase